MESIDLPTGYNPDQYIHTIYSPFSDHRVPRFNTNTNSDTDFQPTPLPIIRQNAFTES